MRVTALLTACFIVIGMSKIQSLAETGGDQGTDEPTISENIDSNNDEGGDTTPNNADAGGLLEDSNPETNSLSDNADTDSTIDAGTEGSTGSSSADGSSEAASSASAENSSDVSNSASTESSSNEASTASTESSSDAASTASTDDKPRVLSSKRELANLSLNISEVELKYANGAKEGDDYRYDKDSVLRTRDAVTISAHVWYQGDKKVSSDQASTAASSTTETVTYDAVKDVTVTITYIDLTSNTQKSCTMEHTGNGYYTYTFPDEVGAYQVVSITAEDQKDHSDSYNSDDATTEDGQKVFYKISVEQNYYNSGNEESTTVNYVTNYNRILSAGNNKTSAYSDDPWISLQGVDDPEVSLTIEFTSYVSIISDTDEINISLIQIDEDGNEVDGEEIKGDVDTTYRCLKTTFTVTFNLPNDKDQYGIYKLSSEGDRFVNCVVNGINNKTDSEGRNGYYYVKIDSTSPVAQNIKVNYESDDGVTGEYSFGGSEEKIVYSTAGLTLKIDTSESYDPPISTGSEDSEENEEVAASGIVKLSYVLYNDEYPLDGDGMPCEVAITDGDTDECEDIRIDLPGISNNEGPVYIANVKLIDAAGNVTLVNEGKVEPVSYVIDNVKPVINFTELDGESLSEGYATDLASTTYFYNHDVTGKLAVTERYIKEVKLSEKSGYMKASLSQPDEVNNELGAVTEYTFSSTGDGDYFFSADAEDMSGNAADTVDGPYFVVDTIAPVITVTYTSGGSSVTPQGKDQSYYNETVIVSLKIEDKHLLQDGIEAVITGTKADGTSVNIPVSTWTNSEGSDIWTAEVELTEDGEYALTAKATDRAQNVSDTYTGKGFTIDRTTPVVTITFDNNSPMNEIYYNASRTATITVKDYTFDSSKCELNINAPDNAPSEGDWNTSGDQTYVKTVSFNNDGRYDFTFKTTDKAGNESETYTISLFIIDTTAPVVTVTYDNDDVRNGFYYNASRTATIQIDEKSFDESLVVIDIQPSDNDVAMSALPKNAAFKANASKDVYTSSMSFDTDGKYGYTITVTDLAGNKSEIYTSDIFVIDMTAPDITFSGVENYSANNSEVAPVLIYKDVNIDQSASVVTLTGANHGEVSQDNVQTVTTDTVTISYSDFAYNKETDDLYTLSVSITDMAGNVTEDELVFSVNRYGSVYVISQSTQELTDKYYTNEPVEVSITEINVDSLTYKEVSVDRDGDSEVLREGRDYTVTTEGDDKSWKSMTYTLNEDNFKKDGNYSVMVYSKDRATNTQDNRSAEKEIEFAVDTTAPSVVTSGIKEEGVYEEEEHDFIINVTDNMGIESLVVYTGQSELSELVSFTGEDIDNNGGNLTVTIPGLEERQNVMILTTDVAGNQSELDYNNILVASNAKELIEDEKAPLIKEIDSVVPNPKPDPFKVWAAVAGGFIGVSGTSAAGIYLYRKKKLPKTKE